MEHAIDGESGKIVGFKREYENDKYICKTELMPLTCVANEEKIVPREWINTDGNGMTQEFIDYALPLIQGENMRVTVKWDAPLCEIEKSIGEIKYVV